MVGHGIEPIGGFGGGPRGEMLYIEWSSDGQMVAASARKGGVVVWHRAKPDAPQQFLASAGDIAIGLAWHPASPMMATALEGGLVQLWDVETGAHIIVCELADVACGVAWSPSGDRLAVTGHSGVLSVRDVAKRAEVLRTDLGSGHLYQSRWSADGHTLVTGGADGRVFVLDAADASVQQTLGEATRSGQIYDAAITHDGELVAAAFEDGTIRVWERGTGLQRATLEGHGGPALSIAFSPGGEVLASVSASEIRLWRPADWECVGEIHGGARRLAGGLAFHPAEPILTAKNESRGGLDCWRLDFAVLAGRAIGTASRRYVNAKVVLLGDTGVGKSGLGLVLSGQPYAKTDSTHGRNVWVFEPPGSGTDTREVLLWDLAGQPGYRLVHQLHLNEVAVALVVFDSRDETDPFAGVKHWARALAHARQLEGDAAVPGRTFLVAARADRGGVPVTRERVDALVDQLGFDGFFETSAKEGWEITELTAAVLGAIEWASLPIVSSNELLVQIRAFVLDVKQSGRVLATVDDLYREYARTATADAEGRDLRMEFEACIGRVESRGLVRRLRFGGFVLLQPELLDAYASALVQAAKDEPDGLGVIAEEDVLAARFRLAEATRIESREEEKLLLIATVEELMRHEVALKATTDRGVDLVFPSQFTRERPDAPDIEGHELTLGFEGALHNVYATLAVRLARSHLFERREMWHNAATYASVGGGVCGIYLREIEEGRGELDVFFDDVAAASVRREFETYVVEHVQQRAGPAHVTQRRVLRCPDCRYVLPDKLVKLRLARGADEMRCPACEGCAIALVRADEQLPRPDAAVTEMHLNANARREIDVAATRLKGKIETNDYDVFLCHNSRDKAEVKAIGEALCTRGLHVWLDEWEIRPGTSWQHELEKAIRNIRSAAIFVGARKGPWQDLELKTFIDRFAKKRLPVIPVILTSREGNPRLPTFLPLLHAVDMRKAEPDPIDQLVWGITGERPAM